MVINSTILKFDVIHFTADANMEINSAIYQMELTDNFSGVELQSSSKHMRI